MKWLQCMEKHWTPVAKLKEATVKRSHSMNPTWHTSEAELLGIVRKMNVFQRVREGVDDTDE